MLIERSDGSIRCLQGSWLVRDCTYARVCGFRTATALHSNKTTTAYRDPTVSTYVRVPSATTPLVVSVHFVQARGVS